MKYPKRVHTLGEVVRFVRRKPNTGERATWHSKEREVHCTGAGCPSGEQAVKTYYKVLMEAGVDIAGMDIKDADIGTLAAIVTDGFCALMEAQE